jgi:hypothetical protein
MELRLDHLLTRLRERPAEILERIDRDPLLVKRESGGLVLANASQVLFTPQEEHHLYAKGIVFRRDPYRLVSLPLIKIYNLGERQVTVTDLMALGSGAPVQARFLRKLDGSLVQLFAADGRTWFTTRGMIEGAAVPRGAADDEARERKADFDYLATARRLAEEKYPALLEEPAALEHRVLVFELIHPQARIITDYGDREDLVLLAAFDLRHHRYLGYADLLTLGQTYQLSVVDALTPRGDSLAAQIDDLLAALAGTDQEGSVLTFERGDQVIYRVKIKSPDYLLLMRLLSQCSYAQTVALLDANPHLGGWPDVEAYLREQGREKVPEEVLAFYRQYYEMFQAYRADCAAMIGWAQEVYRRLHAAVAADATVDPRQYRKAFAALATRYPYATLIFAALDGRLDLERVRKHLPTPDEARQAVEATQALKRA